ncbi:MAG: PPOX class F420-dependent oxidoreductase [SAR202 cluster bacterium]|nr:PPOX class F420-dependent oxidoreductase [SAR202 cluster bacterium]
MVIADLQQPSVLDFLAKPLLAKLVTLNRDGSPQITFMWHEMRDGQFYFSTTKERLKFANVSRDPRAAVAIDDPQNMQRGVIARGVATITEEGAVDLVTRLAERYSGPEGARRTRERALRENRIIIRLEPKRVRIQGF